MARTRTIESGAVTALAPLIVLVPFWLVAMTIAWAVIRIAVDLPFWTVPAAWIALGITLFVPAVQAAVLSPVLGVRRPRPDEVARIAPVWDRLIAEVGKGGHRFTYRIVDSDELNAYACGGHLVVVTSFAVDELPASELAGVLAHELSHHLGLHTVALTVGHWLSLPIVALARIGFFLQNVARAATESFVQHSAALTALGRVIAGLLTGISWIFLAVLHASDAVGNLVGHQAEYEADRRAIDLGHGPELAAALRRLIQLGGGRRAIGFRARLGASHPAARTRVARIEALLRHPTMR